MDRTATRIGTIALWALGVIGALAAFAALGGTKGGLDGILGIALGALVYLFPVLAAWRRHAPNLGSVAVINVLLGWTIVGWIVALAMALRDPRPAA